MRVGRSPLIQLSAFQRPAFCLSSAPSKRKGDPYGALLGTPERFYPSPPMSVPPSPPPTTAGPPRSPFSSAITQPTTVSTAPATTIGTTLTGQLGGPPTTPSAEEVGVSSAASSSVSLIPSDHPGNVPPAFAAYNTFPTRAPRRTGRKANPHVASACVNCKRAHLSCDVQRPCTRCITAGKQDTCYDVQHKKRGRPRLRDEGTFQAGEQIKPASAPRPTLPDTTATASSSRPIATPRPRRASSLRSQASEGHPSQPISLLSTSRLQPPQTYQQPSNASLAPGDIPIAFLDLDLRIIRANRSFELVMANDRLLPGSRLSDIASLADGSSLQSILNRVKAERDTREQSVLPPIYPSTQHDPIENVSEADIDRLTSGFEDATYTWTRGNSSTGPSTDAFPARVRLARSSSTYFIVITLPTLRPMTTNPPQQQQIHPQPRQQYPPLLQQSAQSQAPTLPELRASRSISQPPAPSLLSPYSTSPWPPPRHQQAPLQNTSRLAPLEPAPEILMFPRRTSQTDMLPPTDPGGVQLPPIGGGDRRPSLPISGAAVDSVTQQQRRSASDDEASQRSPKKRKIMGIDNVLQ